MLYFYSYRIKIVCPRRPVISAVYRAEENDERAEDRSSLPEPIFYGGTLSTFSRVSLSGFISRARTLSLSLACVLVHTYTWKTSTIHARWQGIHSPLEKSLEEWSISYECIPCKCAVDRGERRGGEGEEERTERSFLRARRGFRVGGGGG